MAVLKPIRIAYITFLECELRGTWHDIQGNYKAQMGKGGKTYFTAWREKEAQVWLVRSDGLRRNFAFKNKATITVHQGMIQFNQEDLLDEFGVDEDEQAGKQPKSKIDFT